MPKTVYRPLTIADMAILIVGVAIGMWIVRFSRETYEIFFLLNVRNRAAHRAILAFAPFSLALAGSLLAMRAIHPRPRWRVVFRQPGTLASIAILAHMSFVVLITSWHVYLVPIFGLPNYRPHFNTYLETNRESGAWVAVSWATLALSGVWRPEPSWLDRLGRLLGVVAILIWLCLGVIW